MIVQNVTCVCVCVCVCVCIVIGECSHKPKFGHRKVTKNWWGTPSENYSMVYNTFVILFATFVFKIILFWYWVVHTQFFKQTNFNFNLQFGHNYMLVFDFFIFFVPCFSCYGCRFYEMCNHCACVFVGYVLCFGFVSERFQFWGVFCEITQNRNSEFFKNFFFSFV